ncbi:hypothetical protein ACHAW6_003043 [Cyclotella cf. meneghiniana]
MQQILFQTWAGIGNMDEFSFFCLCCPEEHITNMLIPATNRQIKGDVLTFSEFSVVLGYHFFMTCFYGISDFCLWSSQNPIDTFEGASLPFNDSISCNFFIAITEAIRHTKKESRQYFLDRFYELRDLMKGFNHHYKTGYHPSWLI